MDQHPKEAHAIGEGQGDLQSTQCGTKGVKYEEMNDTMLLWTRLFGNRCLPYQTGNLEPLQSHQRLVIPSALGMAVITGGTQRCTGNAILRARYLRATTFTYAQIAGFVDGEYTPTQICCMADNFAEPVVNCVRRTDWFEEAWYLDAAGEHVPREQGDITMGAFSHILQFNCDVRDYGFLLMPEGTTSNTAWRDIGALEEDRLKVRLQPYSLECIATLNYVPVGYFPLSAWVRAYGVAFGVTPSDNSPDLHFSDTLPSDNDMYAVTYFKKGCNKPLLPIVNNVISMFGFMHLSKNGTYRTGDTNLERNGSSYINSLRSLTNQGLMTQIEANKESIIRTASQPFGLAQTYWFGKAMHKFKILVAFLMDKHDVTPPTVQRLMIVDLGTREWDGFEAGRTLSQKHAQELNQIRNEIALVKANAPAYSDFHSLYGYPVKSRISTEAEAAIHSLLIKIYGFVMATHVSKRGKRSGLALAMCWKKIERDYGGVATLWKRAWVNYVREELAYSSGQLTSPPIFQYP